MQDAKRVAKGLVLDIGCGSQAPRSALEPQCTYVGLDYYKTAIEWYGSRPDAYADAQCLPIAGGSVETVLLLDVLEHLPRPRECLAEIARVLTPGGTLLLQVPFLYPLHDEPLDFQRWTSHGLRQIVSSAGLVVAETTPIGKPLETAGLMLNLALSKSCIEWLNARHPAAILVILMPILIPLVNCLTLLMGALGNSDGMMPHAYRLVCKKI